MGANIVQTSDCVLWTLHKWLNFLWLSKRIFIFVVGCEAHGVGHGDVTDTVVKGAELCTKCQRKPMDPASRTAFSAGVQRLGLVRQRTFCHQAKVTVPLPMPNPAFGTASSSFGWRNQRLGLVRQRALYQRTLISTEIRRYLQCATGVLKRILK